MKLELTLRLNIHFLNPLTIKVETATPADIKGMQKQLKEIMDALEELKQEVRETRDATKAGIVLIKGLKVALDNAILAGPEALKALSAELQATQDDMGAAITENTPAANTTED